MKLSETLLKPTRGLPDIAGQASLRVLYQQASANSINSAGEVEKNAVTLHDPTRAKGKDFKLDSVEKLSQSVVTSTYNGRIYFPNLPPQLANRFYLDPLMRNKRRLHYRYRSPHFGGRMEAGNLG